MTCVLFVFVGDRGIPHSTLAPVGCRVSLEDAVVGPHQSKSIPRLMQNSKASWHRFFNDLWPSIAFKVPPNLTNLASKRRSKTVSCGMVVPDHRKNPKGSMLDPKLDDLGRQNGRFPSHPAARSCEPLRCLGGYLEASTIFLAPISGGSALATEWPSTHSRVCGPPPLMTYSRRHT